MKSISNPSLIFSVNSLNVSKVLKKKENSWISVVEKKWLFSWKIREIRCCKIKMKYCIHENFVKLGVKKEWKNRLQKFTLTLFEKNLVKATHLLMKYLNHFYQFSVHIVEKWRIYSHWKNISSIWGRIFSVRVNPSFLCTEDMCHSVEIHDFSDTQILREINFGVSRRSETAILRF